MIFFFCLYIQFNSIQLKFISIQQGYKTFYKVYIYIEFVLQFVRNNTKWIMKYRKVYTMNWIIKENNAYFVGLTKKNTTDGKEWSTKKQCL